MTELNSLPPSKVRFLTGFKFEVDVDATGFSEFDAKGGFVENVKVPKRVEFHSLKRALTNPVATTKYGMLETPDLRFWGRSEQLHLAFSGIWDFHKT